MNLRLYPRFEQLLVNNSESATVFVGCEMTKFYSTRDVAQILGIRPDSLSRHVWLGKLDPPTKSPSGSFLWTEQDIERASWVLLRRAYKSQGGTSDDC